MRKLLLAFALLLAPSAALAQCNGLFPPHTFCGNATGATGIAGQVPQSSSAVPGGSSGQVQYNNSGNFGGATNITVGPLGTTLISPSISSATITGTTLISPVLTGSPITPTPSTSDNSTLVINSAWIRLQTWLASIVTYLATGTGAISITLQTWLGIVIVPESFGAVGDCSTNDQTPITQSITAAVAQSKAIVLGVHSCYAHNGTLSFSSSNLNVKCNGFVTLKQLATTAIANVAIDGGPNLNDPTLHNINFCYDNPPFLEGNSSSGVNLLARGVVHDSHIGAIGGDAATTSVGLQVNFCVGAHFRLVYNANTSAGYTLTSKPSTAVSITNRGTGETSSFCHFDIIAESMTAGVNFTNANGNFVKGFSENNTSTGLYLNNSLNNTFTDWDSENNGGHGIFLDTGSQFNQFISANVAASGVGNDLFIASGANRNTFIGGQYNAITDNGTSNVFIGLQAVTFSPNTASWSRIYNASGIAYADRPTPPLAIASLPSCTSTNKGARGFVIDATSTGFAYHATATAGGSTNVSVACDGTNWYYD